MSTLMFFQVTSCGETFSTLVYLNYSFVSKPLFAKHCALHWKDFKRVWFLLYFQMSALEWVLPGRSLTMWFDLEKLLSHLVHFNDFSPLWVLCWILKTDVEKLLSHLVHLNAFSPVWFLSGFFLSNLILRSSHIVHLCEFSPVFSGNQMWNSSYHRVCL